MPPNPDSKTDIFSKTCLQAYDHLMDLRDGKGICSEDLCGNCILKYRIDGTNRCIEQEIRRWYNKHDRELPKLRQSLPKQLPEKNVTEKNRFELIGEILSGSDSPESDPDNIQG